MEEAQQSKKIIMVGFFTQELRDLIEHLETTGYSESHSAHLKKILDESTSSSR